MWFCCQYYGYAAGEVLGTAVVVAPALGETLGEVEALALLLLFAAPVVASIASAL